MAFAGDTPFSIMPRSIIPLHRSSSSSGAQTHTVIDDHRTLFPVTIPLNHSGVVNRAAAGSMKKRKA